MQKFGKLGLILLIIVSIIAVSAAVALYTIMEEERNKRIAAEEQVTQITTEKKKIESELDETIKIKDKLKADYEEQKLEAQRLAKQLEDEIMAKEKIASSMAQKEKDLARLEENVNTERNAKLKLTNELSKFKKDFDGLQKQFEELRMAKDALEKKMVDMRQEKVVGLEKIVVKEDAKGAATPVASGPAQAIQPAAKKASALEGQVLVVNKEFAFVVINLGNKNGINPEAMFEVYRGDKFLAKVQIERIYDTMSSAVILPEFKKDEIKEGDTVKSI